MTLRKRSIGLVLLVLILPLLCGCPYSSDVPMSKSSKAKIDKELLGEWKFADEKEQGSGTISIRQFNDHELVIYLLVEQSKGGEIEYEIYRAFVTVIENENFLNFQKIEASPQSRSWTIINYIISGDTLKYRLVGDKLFNKLKKPITSSRALYRFVKRNLHNKDLYDGGFQVLKRVTQ
ncbi:MAG: hypothetical protein DRG50_07340 [Deltaproteobacteria bacterium]|nr:MAG: hypothetical protein DRG50_07340 [Deltaproteobacteria bacterium]